MNIREWAVRQEEIERVNELESSASPNPSDFPDASQLGVWSKLGIYTPRTRFGVVPHPRQGDLLLGGFVRGSGPITPLDLARAMDDEGNPVGYTILTGSEQLSVSDRGVFESLPARFRFKDARERMGNSSDSNTTRLLKRCESLQILRRDGKEYVKVQAGDLERMECVESVQ